MSEGRSLWRYLSAPHISYWGRTLELYRWKNHQYARCEAHSQPRQCGDRGQREASIASEVFQNLACVVYVSEGRSFSRHLPVYNGVYCAISTKENHQNAKLLGCIINIVNGVMVYNRSHSLLLKCLKTLLGCLWKRGEAAKGNLQSLMGCTRSIPPSFLTQTSPECHVGGLLSVWQMGVIGYKRSQPLLLKCFKTWLECIC